MPSTEEMALPKLRFPDTDRHVKNKVRVYPSSTTILSKGPARKSLARLRALQEAIDCLENSSAVPEPFCFVPRAEQMDNLYSKTKDSLRSSFTTSVDTTVNFFENTHSSNGDPAENGLELENLSASRSPQVVSIPSLADNAHGGKTSEPDGSDLWCHLHHETIWETVLDNYYSLCSVTGEQRRNTLTVYVKQKGRKKTHTKCPSFSDLARKIGLLPEYAGKSNNDSNCITGPTDNGATNSLECTENKGPTHPHLTPTNGPSHSEAQGGGTDNGDAQKDCSNSEGVVGGHTHVCSEVGAVTGELDYGPTKALSKIPVHEDEGGDVESESTEETPAVINSEKDTEQCKAKDKPTEYKTNHMSSRLVMLELDHDVMAQLTGLPDTRWTLDEDMELVKYLASQNSTGIKGMLKHSVRFGVIKPDMFSSSSLVRYPKISSFSAETLAYRAVVLHRVSLILDSVLFLLGGSSLLHDQYLKLTHRDKFPLESFSESSFSSSNKLSGLGSRGDAVPGDVVVTQNLEKEKVLQMDEVLSVFSENLNDSLSQKELLVVQAQVEIIVQKIKALKGLQEQFNEQMKVLKKQENEHEKEIGALIAELRKLKDEQRKLMDKGEHRTRRTKISRLSSGRSMSDENLKSTKTWSSKSASGESMATPHSKYRHQPGTILPRVRFLLPLSQRRWPLVHDMLRSSELPRPEHLPIITVDRTVPLQDRLEKTKTVFVQVFNELKKEDLHFRWNKRRFEQWWEVKFIGEGIIDQGGGFRDSLAEISDELCPSEVHNKEILPFFIKTPNQRSQFGENLDAYIPNPSCEEWDMLHWIGKLMGAAYRTDESLPISMPPFVWKVLVGEHVTWTRDFRGVDEAAVKMIDDLETLDEETFNSIYSPELCFVSVLSNGEIYELRPGGGTEVVSAADLTEYTSGVRKARMMESVKQIKAIREGLVTVIPEAVLGMLTWQELERGVCGEPNISLTLLKTSCQYSDDLSSTSECVTQLWSVLKEFSNEERSRFLRFVTGRKRLPAPFMVAKSSSEHDCLPSASTCASTLYLPPYSTLSIAVDKMRYAIYNCVAIDTDTCPW